MNKKPDDAGGPAFPANESHGMNSGEPGMTLREYAAIKLKVPNSGTDWLDDMIRASLRDDFAESAMQGIIAAQIKKDAICTLGEDYIANSAYSMANFMMDERKDK